jgi:alkylhydroperoxidase family enzyme
MDADALRSLAPEAFAAFDTVWATVETLDPSLVALARGQVAAALEGTPVDPTVPAAVARFAEQFVVDVSAITPEIRAAAMAELGAAAFDAVQALYVFDWRTRLDAAFRQCFGTGGMPIATSAPAASLWDACEAMFAAVARARALDPLTTELVRLRGARSHDCRLCKSLRAVEPANDGVGETTYDQIDAYEQSTLSERHKAALRLTDALVWQPTAFPEGAVAAVHDHFVPAETVELLFDVARNAANKIAVAFGADDPHVADGIEYFGTDDAGTLRYGLVPTSEATSDATTGSR